MWRVCDPAFGRYWSLDGAEQWSRDHYQKSLIPKMLFFDVGLREKNNEVMPENCFRAVTSPGASRRFQHVTVLERSIEVTLGCMNLQVIESASNRF